MFTRFLALGATIACAPSAPSFVPTERSAGPAQLEMYAPRFAYAGQPYEISARGAPPHASLAIVLTRRTAGQTQCPSILDGWCTDRANPTLLLSLQADANGEASRTTLIPEQIDTLQHYLHTVVIGSGSAMASAPLPMNTVSATLDTDRDGLPDRDEVWVYQTDRFVADSDGDSALDGIEVSRGLDPHLPDTDGDGISDGEDPDPLVVGPFDPFVIDDDIVSDPSLSLPDPEFDPTGPRIAWQTSDGQELWIADVDPATGAFLPSHGRGTLVDVNIAPTRAGANGVEWAVGRDGARLVYAVRNRGEDILWHAREQTDGSWFPRMMPGRTIANAPLGSIDPTDPRPKVTFIEKSAGSAVEAGWREIESGTTETWFTDLRGWNRWVPGQDAVIGVYSDGFTRRAAIRHVRSGHVEHLPHPDPQHEALAWRAPEEGNEVFAAATSGTDPFRPTLITVYRRVGGIWTPVNEIAPPAGMPYASSLETLVWNGTSYILFRAAPDPPLQDDAVGAIWVAAALDPNGLLRRVSDPVLNQAKDPEAFVHGARPWAYYSQLVGEVRVIHRVELGLP